MAQPSVSAYFKKRKNINRDYNVKTKNIELSSPSSKHEDECLLDDDLTELKQKQCNVSVPKCKATKNAHADRSVVKRTGSPQITKLAECMVSPKKISKIVEDNSEGQSSETLKESKDASVDASVESTTTEITPKSHISNIEKGLKTPTKQIIKSGRLQKNEINSLVKKELCFNEVKTIISRSAKMNELKASLGRLQELEKLRKTQEEENKRSREAVISKKASTVQLKQFDNIELEVLSSPSKTFKTPTKLPPPTPDKHELMSPKHTNVSKSLLFSPSKDGSPSKMLIAPAYQRFMYLADAVKPGKLTLPHKYRNLLDIFKAVDSVCAMFYNRNECITYKKLKPAVQRMLRKNFTENHLAQIKHIYPNSYGFRQVKMRNYGSTSKADYFQLVVTPKVIKNAKQDEYVTNENDKDDVMKIAQNNPMNPQVLTQRMQHFHELLLDCVKEEHDKYLKTLDPPLSICKEKIIRWHPDFDLESCPDIEIAALPQPPNVDKYSSAKEILSTARNLFNCGTPIEKSLQRCADQLKVTNEQKKSPIKEDESKNVNDETPKEKGVDNIGTSKLFKGVPKALLDKIRARQTAKVLDAMTRRPSQDEETTKYSRLPELARHLRNVFVTEKRGVLAQEVIIKKIQNSYRTYLSPLEIEQHLQLLAKEIPAWLAFHEVRKTTYLKMNKEMDLTAVIEQLEKVAKEKSKL